jgi:hypothetical protein
MFDSLTGSGAFLFATVSGWEQGQLSEDNEGLIPSKEK